MSILSPTLTSPVCRDVPVLSIERRDSPHAAESELFTLVFSTPDWENWQPGQFVMVRPQSLTRQDILWGRPFSISQANREETRVVFQTVGRGTQDMLGLQRGELITVWGPLGNAFAVSDTGPTLLLAGGIGLAPFAGYIARHPRPDTLRLEFGHRLPLECYPFAECTPTACTISDTADGSGFYAKSYQECGPADLALFITALENSIRAMAAQNGLVLACGPMPFLRSVQKFALQYGARAQLSLETRMACGVGACLGCVAKYTAAMDRTSTETPEAFEYVQTCTKGPVFWADEIDIDQA
ncbi:MAG: Dihydroorotate dehydrogenase B (NAD(+)), electron transfer subunit [Desulfovibrio sp.]